MVGNVQEWCRDAYRAYDPQQLTDPVAIPFGPSDERVVRGGSFLYDYDYSLVQKRSKNPPHERYPDTGFRCVLAVRELW
jgi:formylglycine-generating enzyme required for sulfatase activity